MGACDIFLKYVLCNSTIDYIDSNLVCSLLCVQVLRPFLLRRLKNEVEKQMPQKFEHVVMCRLSKRQRYLYDDFMSQGK